MLPWAVRGLKSLAARTVNARLIFQKAGDGLVNASRCPSNSFHRDGAMRVDGNKGSTLHYEPNSYGEWQEQPEFAEPPLKLEGATDRWNFRQDDDYYYTQPGKLFRLMKPEQQKVLL